MLCGTFVVHHLTTNTNYNNENEENYRPEKCIWKLFQPMSEFLFDSVHSSIFEVQIEHFDQKPAILFDCCRCGS